MPSLKDMNFTRHSGNSLLTWLGHADDSLLFAVLFVVATAFFMSRSKCCRGSIFVSVHVSEKSNGTFNNELFSNLSS
jgi:hypothetical protein